MKPLISSMPRLVVSSRLTSVVRNAAGKSIGMQVWEDDRRFWRQLLQGFKFLWITRVAVNARSIAVKTQDYDWSPSVPTYGVRDSRFAQALDVQDERAFICSHAQNHLYTPPRKVNEGYVEEGPYVNQKRTLYVTPMDHR